MLDVVLDLCDCAEELRLAEVCVGSIHEAEQEPGDVGLFFAEDVAGYEGCKRRV